MTTKQVALVSPAPRYFGPLRQRRDPFSRLRRLPRLALLALESVTPPEWDVTIVDERVQAFDPDAIEAPIVGITTMTYMAPRAFEMARLLKMRGKTVVLGGYFPTLSPNLALAEDAVDAIVVGRGEDAWPRLLADFEAGRLQSVYDVPFGQDGFKLRSYNHHLTAPRDGYNGWLTQVQAGLGCKFRCSFCVIPGFHRDQVALRDLDDLVDEVARAPTRRVLFIDDNLLNRPAYLHALCDRLRPLGKEWIAQVSMDIGTQPKLIEKMAKAGCGWLNVGVESIHSATLDAQSKWQNDTRRYLKTLDRFRDHGISVSAGMVLGFPTEPRDVFDLTGEFLDKAAIDITVFHLYTPYPGTRAHAEYEAAGRLLTNDLELYDTYHPIVRPENYDPAELVEKMEWLEERFYRPRRVLGRAARGFGRGGAYGLVRTLATGVEGYVNLRQGLPLHP
ncbi:MAG: radical SAM protein [Deltaproteobacteria bacterium]